jgi:hypothetical protein
VKRIGDIVRIHRANVKIYKEVKQFNVNVFYNSSWCLFNSDPNNTSNEDQDVEMEDNNSDNNSDADNQG